MTALVESSLREPSKGEPPHVASDIFISNKIHGSHDGATTSHHGRRFLNSRHITRLELEDEMVLLGAHRDACTWYTQWKPIFVYTGEEARIGLCFLCTDSPVRWLPQRYSSVRDIRFPILDGIDPVNQARRHRNMMGYSVVIDKLAFWLIQNTPCCIASVWSLSTKGRYEIRSSRAMDSTPMDVGLVQRSYYYFLYYVRYLAKLWVKITTLYHLLKTTELAMRYDLICSCRERIHIQVIWIIQIVLILGSSQSANHLAGPCTLKQTICQEVSRTATRRSQRRRTMYCNIVSPPRHKLLCHRP